MARLVLLLVVGLVVVGLACGAVPADQILALEELYYDTGGAGWRNNDNWLNGRDPCSPGHEWFGLYKANAVVPCGEKGIEAIVFAENGLKGTLPDVLDVFRELVSFVISDDVGVRGSLPASLFDAPQLSFLSLTGTKLSGTIPRNICNVTQALVSLTIMNPILGFGRVGGSFPSEIGKCSKLTTLAFKYTAFTSPLPSEIGELVSLRDIIFEVAIVGDYWPFPTWICNLVGAKSLVLSVGYLNSSLPSCLGNLRIVQEVTLYDNNLTGELPVAISKMSSLSTLRLNANGFTGRLPPEYGVLRKLQFLSLSGNLLSGELPASYGRLSDMKEIRLSTNQFTGTVPDSWGSWTSVSKIHLDNNRLSGTLKPTVFCNVTTIVGLNLAINSFTGTVPACLTELPRLRDLLLGHNDMVGTLPDMSASALVEVDFTANRFSERLPNLSLTTQMAFFGGNLFTGTIPASYSNIRGGYSLSVANNQLSGTIPRELLGFANILDFSNNKFTGLVDDAICNDLYFNLSGNPGLLCPLPSCCQFGQGGMGEVVFRGCSDDCKMLWAPYDDDDHSDHYGVGRWELTLLVFGGACLVLSCAVVLMATAWGCSAPREPSQLAYCSVGDRPVPRFSAECVPNLPGAEEYARAQQFSHI